MIISSVRYTPDGKLVERSGFLAQGEWVEEWLLSHNSRTVASREMAEVGAFQYLGGHLFAVVKVDGFPDFLGLDREAFNSVRK